MDYFQGCATPEQRKKRLRALAKQHHPDRGGDEKIMQEINSQFKGNRPRPVNTESHKSDADGYYAGFSKNRQYGGFSYEGYTEEEIKRDQEFMRAKRQSQWDSMQEAQERINKRAEEIKAEKERAEYHAKFGGERKAQENFNRAFFGGFTNTSTTYDEYDPFTTDRLRETINRFTNRQADREKSKRHDIPEPCPFCKSTIIEFMVKNIGDSYFAICESCGCRGPCQLQEDTIVHGKYYRWNRRPK